VTLIRPNKLIEADAQRLAVIRLAKHRGFPK
jgi:hypothetical protein